MLPELERGLDVLAEEQSADGAWKGDYSGPLFLIPVYVSGLYAMGIPFSDPMRTQFTRYLRKHQNADGGWGLDVESPSLVFTSVLNYVALRLLGVSQSDPDLKRAQTWFLPLGGALSSGSWGKFVLCLLRLHAYQGLQPLLPEMWLLPPMLPVHPSKLWCHCRMVYLPMSYLYGRRSQIPDDPLLTSLRSEIYAEPYHTLDWKAARNRVAPTDAYRPRTRVLRGVNRLLSAYEKIHSSRVRQHALARVLDHIRAEDEATHYLCIGPINKVLNMLVWHFENPGGPEVEAHLRRLPDYLQTSSDGLKVNGYNSSEMWNTAFAVQAIAALQPDDARSEQKLQRVLSCAANFIESNQILENTIDNIRYFRHPSKGGWPFSTRDHGWPISDCTGEGLKASLLLQKRNLNRVSEKRLADASQFILSLQNREGGWATYEPTRGPRWLELLNPSDVFGDIMIDYSYVECTSSCLQALSAYLDSRPARDTEDLEVLRRAIARGADYLTRAQRPDGSWEGAWGVCFTYGTWFAVSGLLSAGLSADAAPIKNAVAFLSGHQRSDGGWSETIESSRRRSYVEGADSHAVMTSWALLTLHAAGEKNSMVFKRGIAFLKQRQQLDGRWPPEPIAGVFNRTSAIHYHAYLSIFPLWALAVGV